MSEAAKFGEVEVDLEAEVGGREEEDLRFGLGAASDEGRRGWEGSQCRSGGWG